MPATSFCRSRKLSVALMLLAAWQVVPLVRYMGPNPVAPDPGSSARLRIVMANLLWTNEDASELIALLDREKPDIVGFVEYTEEWSKALDKVREAFPYRLEHPARATGLALWFRTPPTSLGPVIYPPAGGWPLIPAKFDFAGRECSLWLVHPSSPVVPERRKAGFPELEAIARAVQATGGSQIVIGDLNTTDGSPHFGDFLKVSGLRDSRLGFGRQGSWPSDRPYRLAIDHAFVSADLAVIDRRLGPYIGSDHLPIVVELAPAAARKPGNQPSQP